MIVVVLLLQLEAKCEAAATMKCFPEAETEPVICRKIDGIAEVITTTKSLITQLTAEGRQILAHRKKQAAESKMEAEAKAEAKAEARMRYENEIEPKAEAERLAHERMRRVEQKQAKRLRDQARAKARERAAIRERDATEAKRQVNARKARELDAAIDSREARRRAARKARKVEERKLAAIDTDDEDLNSFLLDLSGTGGVQPA